jgi:urate oxidase
MAIPPIGEADRMITLGQNSYGKSRVRVVKVQRHPSPHELRDWTVEILLEGDFASCFVDGDNSKILPTDTMKNTVYSLARSSTAACMEEFGKELVGYLLERNPQVSVARASISEKTWEHLSTHQSPHPTTFLQSSNECQTAEVIAIRNDALTLRSGFDNLVVLKTAGSEFAGFIQDSLTTLAESTDRLLGTAIQARWNYLSPALPFGALRSKIRETLLEVFAAHKSKSVQHTLYAMGEGVLAAVREIADIELTMPNRHCLLVDLSRFGQDNPNEIFVPIDEPHGYIEAHIRRQD